MLPQDCMHVIIEGVLSQHLRRLLLYVVEKRFISLNELNHRLQNFDYGGDMDNIPKEIIREHLEGDGNEKISKQNATQVWLLARVLPFVLQDCLPRNDPHFCIFLKHVEIFNGAMAPEITVSGIRTLRSLIARFILGYVTLYENAYVPKLHYYLHLPRSLLNFGPLRNIWCMRLESKHCELKRIGVLSNFKNLPFTLANRYAAKFCLDFLKKPGCFFLDIFAPRTALGVCIVADVPELIQNLGQVIYAASWIQILGTKFVPKKSILNLESDPTKVPQYHLLRQILVRNTNEFYGELIPLKCDGFSDSYQSWKGQCFFDSREKEREREREREKER
eukprot:Pompholyxophrys_punicea_v1_NODE_195_length_2835_cov_7.655148.p2 type:complete len:334 gc:universal NODE_195_length_2835_cov_7.655148:1108-107(-)